VKARVRRTGKAPAFPWPTEGQAEDTSDDVGDASTTTRSGFRSPTPRTEAELNPRPARDEGPTRVATKPGRPMNPAIAWEYRDTRKLPEKVIPKLAWCQARASLREDKAAARDVHTRIDVMQMKVHSDTGEKEDLSPGLTRTAGRLGLSFE